MNSLVFGILLFIFVGERVDGVKIQFFRSENFRDLNYESNSTAKCNNVPDDQKNFVIFSIRTDTCLMVYYSPNCQGYVSRKFDLDNNLGWNWYVRSFHICNEDIGGPQLKIDITKHNEFSESGVLESYRDVCSCINVPQYVQNMTRWSIINYGNDFLAYYQPDCSENKLKAEHVPAGLWCGGGLRSACMHLYKKTDTETNTVYKIQSIGPDPNSKYFKSNCRRIPINSQFRVKDEQLEKQIETILRANQALKNTTVELKSNQVNHNKRCEDSIVKLKDDFGKGLLNSQQKHDQQFSSLNAKNEQLEKRMDTHITESQAIKIKIAGLESNQENQNKNFEISIRLVKDQFSKHLQNYQKTQDNKTEQLEKHILVEMEAMKNTTAELTLKLENQSISYVNSIAKLDQQFLSLSAKNEQLKNKMDTILTENQALKNKTVELESKLENQYKSFEDSLKKMKNDIRQIFA